MGTTGRIRCGMGGWVFEDWRSGFYPAGLPKSRELEHASRHVTAIEVNGTFYRGQAPETYAKWAAEVPDGFVFSLKAPRYAVNRKRLSEGGESIRRFAESGIAELGNRLGPLLWQFAATKRFEPEDFADFLDLLPKSAGGISLRHVVELRHESFAVPEAVSLCRNAGVAIVCADSEDHPQIADVTADFVYARLQRGDAAIDTCYAADDLKAWARRAMLWSEGGMPEDLRYAGSGMRPEASPRDVFVYFIRSGKPRAPQGAVALIETLRDMGAKA